MSAPTAPSGYPPRFAGQTPRMLKPSRGPARERIRETVRKRVREKDSPAVSLLALCSLLVVFVVARAADRSRRINLPTSKTLTLPVPGYLARTNSFPATIALSPDGRYAALLNQGYGTQEAGARQSIAILDLSNNQLRDFPDDRLSDEYSTPQSYFIGLAFSSDGKASLCLDRLHHRPHRPEAKEHRQRHRGIQIRGRTNHSRPLHQDTAPAHRRRERSSVRPAQNSRRNRNPIPRRPRRFARGKERNGATGVLARHFRGRSIAGGQQPLRQRGAPDVALRAN